MQTLTSRGTVVHACIGQPLQPGRCHTVILSPGVGVASLQTLCSPRDVERGGHRIMGHPPAIRVFGKASACGLQSSLIDPHMSRRSSRASDNLRIGCSYLVTSSGLVPNSCEGMPPSSLALGAQGHCKKVQNRQKHLALGIQASSIRYRHEGLCSFCVACL